MKLLERKNDELTYFGISLKDLAIKYGTPLKISFLDVIKYRVTSLKEAFDKAIKDLNYSGKFIYLNANKANYSSLEIEECFKYSDGLETSSFYDLLFTHKMFEKHLEFMHKLLVSNGYKERNYIDAIVKAKESGIKIIDVIDSLNEYEYLKSIDADIEVGLRIHLKAQYMEEGDTIENDRFGLMKEEFDYIVDDIKNTKMTLSTIHFHQRGFDYEADKFKENFVKAFKDYYVSASKKISTIKYFDMGGGTPLPVSDDFDYYSWAKVVIGYMQELSKTYNVVEPSLISENGKYSQKDAIVNVYKVVGKKKTDKLEWNIVDGSLLIAMPEMYALGEPILVTPINELNSKMHHARLGGITCDCDDVYEIKEKGYIDLPDTDNDIYIGLIGTGSYQNSMNGKGGVHHCLLPEERDLVIYTEDGVQKELLRHDLQSIEDCLEKMGF